LYKEGEERYKVKRPPGYLDKDKGLGKNERESHMYNGLVLSKKYGDLIVWKQILRYVKNENIKHVIFVTDDSDEDWWWIVDSKGSKTIGPRPELVQEIAEYGANLFYMYSSERFLRFASQYLDIRVAPESIESVANVVQVHLMTTETINTLTQQNLNIHLATVRGATFVESSRIEGSAVTVKYFDDFAAYQAARPSSRISAEDYWGYFATGKGLDKLLIREAGGILRAFKEAENVSIIVPFDGRRHTVQMNRRDAEEFFGIDFDDLVESEEWAKRFVDPCVYNKERRDQAVRKFVTVET
jgi:hypothetical protein